METSAIGRALLDILRQGLGNRTLLHGVAVGLHAKGLSRSEIMDFFWRFMDEFPLTDSESDEVCDFFEDLRGNGPDHGIIRLPGDPEDLHELGERVSAIGHHWKPPSR